MGGIAISIDKQIKLLRERGMNFEGFENKKIKEILLDIGYYRLGFYWFDLKKNDGSNNFEEGTNFKTIIDLYYLDNDIRYILIKYLNRIEINFRTNLVYFMSMKYKDDPIWFVNKDAMAEVFIEKFPRHYNNDFIQKHYVIKNHHKKYPECKYAPSWKTLENFPFGSIFKIYECAKDESIKLRISENLGIKPFQKFEQVFKGLVHIRNRCAHGAILYNFYLPKSLPTIPLIEYKDDKRNNLRVVVQVVAYVLSHISENRKNDFFNEINGCLSKFKHSSPKAYGIYYDQSQLDLF
ncbi:Abi family protein [Brumimicrobium mesophilum]|uniref:Abi family protein n=1 Tax=Brumimicrobium mesophilum TaxID=392717 RepID=UPI000D141DB7|nr:Abi family protein [Brumimicrobium mesophilum]